jgi:hypothetical protein
VKKLTAILSFVLLAGTLYINFLGGTGKINGIATGEVSANYPALFTPAGFTFAIWSVIYLLNIGYVLVALINAFKTDGRGNQQQLRLFMLVCLVNAAWIFAWHYEQLEISVVLMLGLLISLIRAFVLSQHKSANTFTTVITSANFSVYLGWISVATIANISALLISWGVAPRNETAMVLTLLVVAVAVVLGAWQLIKFSNVWYALVLIWAFYGIWQARSAESSDAAGYIAGAVLAGAILVLVTGGYVFTRKFVSLRS